MYACPVPLETFCSYPLTVDNNYNQSASASLSQLSKNLPSVRINENLAHLTSILESWWFICSRALTTVENDVKALTLASKNNQDLLEAYISGVEETVQQEAVKTRKEQAAANVAIISAVESAMESRLAWIESSVDVLISQHRAKTKQEDAELHKIKDRVSASRKHLQEAATAGRKCLKHFGLFVKAIDKMHSNPSRGGYYRLPMELLATIRYLSMVKRWAKVQDRLRQPLGNMLRISMFWGD